MVGRFLNGVHGLRAGKPHENPGMQGGQMGLRAGSDPDDVVAEQALVDQHALDLRERERRHGARRKSGRLLDLGRARDPRLRGTDGAGDLVQVGTPIARYERDDGLAVAVQHERLHDLIERAPGGLGGVLGGRRPRLELLEPRFGAGLPEIGGDPFDGLRPGRAHGLKGTRPSEPEPGGSSVVSPVDNSEIEKIARTDALYREVNERIAETAERFEATETSFVCECAEPACTHRLEATIAEYERVRPDGDTFLLAPGHEDERVEAVVRETNDHAVVEKRQPEVRRLVLELDPRAG